jgi:hypothetical protein
MPFIGDPKAQSGKDGIRTLALAVEMWTFREVGFREQEFTTWSEAPKSMLKNFQLSSCTCLNCKVL